ncbi:MAG: hypothetical protein K2H68_00135, partial [Bacteroidales bacterium]|nr:hypothetical protein [Bacteroidales bacterium]
MRKREVIYKGLLAVVLGMAALCSAHGQSVDSTLRADMGSEDSLSWTLPEDLYAVDSAATPQETIKQSSSLQSSLSYFAVDSIYVDMKTRVAHLFSQSVVNYSGMKLESDYMEINLPLSEVLAQPTLDTNGMMIGIPHFTDKDNTFDAKEIRYNFRSQKGLIRDVITQQGEIYVHGNMVKKYENNLTFIKNASFTSCDLDKPHFELKAWKAKVVPDKVIAMGSAMLFIEDVPTPLVLPFAL